MQSLYDHLKKTVTDEKGIALVTALLLGMLGMLMVASLLLMVNTGTWMSGSKKRYQIALASAHGGMNFFAKGVIQSGIGGNPVAAGPYGGISVVLGGNLAAKLTTVGPFGSFANTAPWDLTMTFPAQTGPNTSVTSQLVTTTRGNSGTSANLLQSGGVVNNNSGSITPPHIPYLYQTETIGQGAANEKAGLSALYAY